MGSLEATRRLQVLARLDALEAEPLAGVVAEVRTMRTPDVYIWISLCFYHTDLKYLI